MEMRILTETATFLTVFRMVLPKHSKSTSNVSVDKVEVS